jgi:hypothetical protein
MLVGRIAELTQTAPNVPQAFGGLAGRTRRPARHVFFRGELNRTQVIFPVAEKRPPAVNR